MAEDFYSGIYNPDVMSCIANLSNDEVFTSPDLANQMLDLLPQALFQSAETKFTDHDVHYILRKKRVYEAGDE